MRLLYITNGITGAGGLERVLSVKASMLAEQFGYQVHILGLNEVGKDAFFDFSSLIKRHSVSVSGNALSYTKSYINGIQQKVEEIKPDIISVCDDGLKGFFIPRILRKKVPVIYERHVSKLIETASGQTRFSRPVSNMKFRLMNLLAKSFDRFVVLTEGSIGEWDLRNITVIPNPLPFYPAEPSALEHKKVIAVGKQSYQKAYDLLLRSWFLLPSVYKDWELHIYGKTDDFLKLDNLASQFGIADQVFFHSPEKDIESRFLESSIFVLSSRFEGFGMVIIEAMSCGLPVVSFDCPHGPADIISDGKDGFLVENGDTDMFAQKLTLLMQDENLRRELGKAGRETAKKYSPDKIVEQWDELFKSLLKT